jgi:hypothetical protein
VRRRAGRAGLRRERLSGCRMRPISSAWRVAPSMIVRSWSRWPAGSFAGKHDGRASALVMHTR